MKLGLIGNPLGHSWSPEIHAFLIGNEPGFSYELWPLEEDGLDAFFERRDFDGINVTIPYKTRVMQYLDEIDEAAAGIGVVNTVVNHGGRLKGYNTDYAGLQRMMQRHQIDGSGRMTAILGTGGASAAAAEVCRASGREYCHVSRSSKSGSITYEELYERQADIRVIINATPVGMLPDEEGVPVDLDRFRSLEGVVDIVANPVRTRLCFEAGLRGIKCCGGLEMLVGQAVAADELFTGRSMDPALTEKCVKYLLLQRRNIVLTGMPSSGKSTVGRMLAEELGREIFDTDGLIVSRIGMPIADFFRIHGEEAFRDIETEVCRSLSRKSGVIISTGGGIVKREENMRMLSYGGLTVWLDRSPELLTPTDSRPLSSSAEALRELCSERKELYRRYADIRIENNGSPEQAVRRIMGEIENNTQGLETKWISEKRENR